MRTRMLGAIATVMAAVALISTPAGASAARDTSRVFGFSEFSTVGSSSLTADTTGVTMSLRTTGLTPTDAVTVWWVVFNHPENCRTKIDNPSFPFRCGEPDLTNSDVHASVLYAGGHVIGGDGTAGYGARLTAGNADGAILESGLEPAQIDAADIHLVIRDHGPADSRLMPAEIRSFDTCNTTCADVQASVHEFRSN